VILDFGVARTQVISVRNIAHAHGGDVRRQVRVGGGHVQPPPPKKDELCGGNGCDAGGHLTWGGGPAAGQPHVEVNDEPCGGGGAGAGWEAPPPPMVGWGSGRRGV